MRFTIVCAGKLRERFYADAVSEYIKRIKRYADISVAEVSDGPDKKAEAERLIKRIPEGAYKISLEINGKSFSSEAFATRLSELMNSGISHIAFIIGGSDGLDESVTALADMHLSFSEFTFPHMLMRVILSEQIYRAMKIINNEPYHK